MLLDHQARADDTGFQQNGDTGKLVHGLLGWDKLVPESMALYQAGRPTFRLSAKPAAEARMWMIAGIAGGIQPWWHHIGAYHEDRRAYRTAEPVFRWHEEHEQYLINRQPVAGVGVVWSQRNTDYYGRDESAELVDAPYRGVTQALLRARMPYLPVHADHIERDAGRLSALVLPNVGALSDAQCAAVRRFVANGGGLVATGATQPLRRMGRSARRFRAGRSVRRACTVAGLRTKAAPLARPRTRISGYPAAASGTRCCAASKRPTSCRSAARWRPCGPIRA